MTRTLRFAAAAALCAVLAIGAAFAAAVEVAKAKSAPAGVTVESGGAIAAVNASTQFKDGDRIRVESGAALVLEFADGSWLRLVGPAELVIIKLTAEGRWVQLESGVISEAVVGEAALAIQTPYDAALILQNARGFARVEPGERVTFQKLEGDLAQVHRDGRSEDLGRQAWWLALRGAVPAPGADTAGLGAPGTSSGDVKRFEVGPVSVAFAPQDEFRHDLSDGTVRLTYVGDDIGRVDVGYDTSLYLGPGEFVEFDSLGRVVEFTGVSHVYHPLDDGSFYDNPVEDVADASFSRPRNR